ncbi:DNA-binding transcriptional regulator, MarR family [Paenimyroides aquimaris]|uniref:DNA-binding transcriptional regulator, MarR family n=1 Tax=Paenimyroides marinum TaxID=1159016 RepID=A0A1H6LG56_9FLAO|nr:MarR family transcriptional regulator [Paenimyroides aquimaris]SEH85206.1 DNA-binding transcriptional regulator, MarR family [Paenimyroides aquimaris]
MKTTDILTSENKYNLLAGRVPLLINRFLSQKFKVNGIDLTREQWSVLAVLWKKDGCSQQNLVNATSRDKPGITRLLDNLVKEGYVKREHHKTDRRTNLIYLTEKGKDIEQSVMKVVNETIDQSTEGLSQEQTLVLRNAFQLIYDNIKKYEK